MNFALGNTNIAIIGESAVAENLKKLLQSIHTEDPNTDLIFEFVDELPSWSGLTHIALDNYSIADDRFRVTEKLFCYELHVREKPVRALITTRKTDILRKTQKVINKSWRYFHTHGGRAYLHHLKRFVFYVYMPLAELLLLKNQSSFAHCSAVEKAGQAVLFPAWGGVGKTGVMSRYIDDGWKFLSDDSCIIADDGTIHIHPLPMHIYKYHEVQSGELVKKMSSQFNTFDKFLWRFMGQVKKPDKLVRWIGADKVFGKENISTRGTISTVIHMHKHIQCDTFKLKQTMPQEVAALMANTILNEINNLANTSIVVHSSQPIDLIPDIAELHRRIINIYSRAFKKASCYTIAIPIKATAEDIYSFIRDNKLL